MRISSLAPRASRSKHLRGFSGPVDAIYIAYQDRQTRPSTATSRRIAMSSTTHALGDNRISVAKGVGLTRSFLPANVKLHGELSKLSIGRAGRQTPTSGLPCRRLRVPPLWRAVERWQGDLQDRPEARARRDDGVQAVRPALHDDLAPACEVVSQARRRRRRLVAPVCLESAIRVRRSVGRSSQAPSPYRSRRYRGGRVQRARHPASRSSSSSASSPSGSNDTSRRPSDDGVDGTFRGDLSRTCR